ncbi:MAG: RNA-binding domain-containing protein [Prochlorothrix sp.]|nr:RNA-binding domain-containing protein [Prochlorothrix sp.]
MQRTTLENLKHWIQYGEDSGQQFKVNLHNGESLAAEMAAFANSEGGRILIGVADGGEIVGLDRSQLSRLNQLISNSASQLVRSPLVVSTENVPVGSDRVVIVLTVPKGLDKPYFDKNGVIWLKVGADKRRVNSKEELRRIFQISSQFHADELPTTAGLEDLDLLRFRDFLQQQYDLDYPDDRPAQVRLLQSLNLLTADDRLTLAGLLLFGRYPDRLKPQFTLKAVWYAGLDPTEAHYLDSEDYGGSLGQIFENSYGFILRTLHKVQGHQSVNSTGIPEIPTIVFQELLVNALIHRDYLISAPIRLFVFADRIEILSPGTLPNNLTVAQIKAGISNLRNPILASYAAKGLLPYRGLGSGIRRAIAAWPRLELVDDRDLNQFQVIIPRLSLD